MYRHNRKQQLGKQINALPRELGDFTANPRVLWLALCGIGIGVLSAYVALALLRLIGLFTNLFFFHRWDTALISPANNRLGLFEIFVPVVGSLIVGMMARYGSERIRGHGIPEAIESILIKGSRVEPKLAVLKPLSSAISIGSGGPFGAEGPIIMTGGAIGSMLAQFMHLTSAERRTLLVAGAAGGMSATFGTPVAATLLAVELLLFEWKPRSFVPVALASASAACVRHYIIATGPLFSVPSHSSFIGPSGLLGCLAVGVLAGGLSALLTLSVYAAEDAFHKLPIHWMWWPAIGGVVVGLGGLFFPQALGVGYGTIGALLSGPVPGHTLWGILIVKWLIWGDIVCQAYVVLRVPGILLFEGVVEILEPAEVSVGLHGLQQHDLSPQRVLPVLVRSRGALGRLLFETVYGRAYVIRTDIGGDVADGSVFQIPLQVSGCR